jgi:outer membrane protein, heavy metal efflux system
MKLHHLLPVGPVLIFIAQSAAADAPVEKCPPVTSAQDVLNCARENHPDIRRTRLERSQNERLEDLARQRPNPQLDGQFGAISLSNNAALTTELGLLHTIELGGKRGSRIGKARAELATTDADLQRFREDVTSQTLLSLHRLRQLEEELGVMTETIDTFAHQAKLLRTRPSMTPEQDVSFSIFTLAAEDSEFKRNLLENEKQAIIRNLQIAMGGPVPYSKAWLPEEPRESWPSVTEASELSSGFSGVRLTNAQFNLSQADLNLAASAAWPDFQVGPFFESESAGGVRASAVGLQFTLPLPLYHQNTGGRALARAGLLRAEQSLKITQSALLAERGREVALYNNSVLQLKKSRWHQEYERRHQRVESLFKRGVLPSPMVIEAHRQIIEVQRSSHEVELKALESLYRVRVLDGVLPEVKL